MILGPALPESFLEGIAGCKHERDFIGVHRMHLSVIDIRPLMSRAREPVRGPSLILSMMPLSMAGMKRASMHRRRYSCRTQACRPFEIKRLLALDVEHHFLSVNLETVGGFHALDNRTYQEMHLTELAGTSGLFLVTIACSGHLGDGLAVRDFRREKLYLYLVLILKTPFHNIYVLLALAFKNSPASVPWEYSTTMVGSSADILFRASLIFSSSFCSFALTAVRNLDAGNTMCSYAISVPGWESVTLVLALRSFHGTSDVPGIKVGNLLLLLACHCIDGAYPL